VTGDAPNYLLQRNPWCTEAATIKEEFIAHLDGQPPFTAG
jgi:hypothetical protein